MFGSGALARPLMAVPTTAVTCDGIATGAAQRHTASVTNLYSQSSQARIKGSAAEYVLVPHLGAEHGVSVVDASDGVSGSSSSGGGEGGGTVDSGVVTVPDNPFARPRHVRGQRIRST